MNSRFSKFVIVSFFLLMMASNAIAAVFTLTNRQSDFSSTDPIQSAALTAFTTIADSLESTINSGVFSTTSRQGLIDAFGSAQGASTTTLGMDVASNPTYFSLSGGAKFGLYTPSGTSLSDLSTSSGNLPTIGAAVQASVSLGLNAGNVFRLSHLGPLDGKRLNFYVNFFNFDMTTGPVSAGITNFGLHAQYKIIPEAKAGFVAGWGGIDIGTGFEYATSSVSFSTTVNQTTTSALSTGDTIALTFNSPVSIGLKNTTFTIPIQASTNATLLSFITAYMGGGMDVNFGTSEYTGKSTGTVSSSLTGGSLTGVVANPFSATANLDFETDSPTASPPAVSPRIFGGLQASLFVLKLFGQYDLYTNNTWGFTGGARVAF